jgi:hypothetical protein
VEEKKAEAQQQETVKKTPSEGIKRKKKPVEVIENLTVEPFEVVFLVGKTFIVKNDIKIEPGGELIIKDATLFIAENSNFEALNKEWKNITIGGKIKGHIKGCSFKNGRGRVGKEFNNLSC